MKTVITLLLAVVLVTTLKAQDEGTGQISPADVKAASATGGGRHGEGIFNVDLFTGTLGLNIPIFDYSIEGLNAGIYATYEGRGVKVDQIESPIGLGFNLQLGGSIIRQVNGIEDETIVHTENGSQLLGMWHPAELGANARKQEREHDLFTATFCGRTIMFEYSLKEDKYNIYPASSGCTMFKEIYSEAPGPHGTPGHSDGNGLIRFYIRDGDGNIFIFNAGDVEHKVVNYDTNPSTFDAYSPTQKWNLVEIVTKTGQKIKYNFVRYPTSYLLYKSEKVQEIFPNDVRALPVGINIKENKIVEWEGILSYCSSIDYPDGTKVDFIYHDRPEERYCPIVDKIVIRKGYDVGFLNKKTFKFNYAFFQSPWRTFTATEVPFANKSVCLANYNSISPFDSVNAHVLLGLRLKLKAITMLGTDDISEEPFYKFDYYSPALPRRFAPAKDFFGYFNNKYPQYTSINGNTTLSNFAALSSIPIHHYAPYNVTWGQDKTDDINYMVAGSIFSVTNSHGGTLKFEYKSHSLVNHALQMLGNFSLPSTGMPYMDGQNVNDGLCIDQITVHDGYLGDNSYAYKYNFTGGHRFYNGGFFYTPDGDVATGSKLYFGSCIMHMENFNGANHGYSEAEVQVVNNDLEIMKSSKTGFTNLIKQFGPSWYRSDLCLSLGGIPQYDYCFSRTHPTNWLQSYRLGKPLYESSYNRLGTIDRKVEYEYTDGLYDLQQRYIAGRVSGFNNSAYALGLTNGVPYKNFVSAPYFLTKSKTTIYTATGTLTKEFQYEYNSSDYLKKTKWVDENGINNIIENMYVYDLPTPPYIGTTLYKTEHTRVIGNDIKLISSNADILRSFVSYWPGRPLGLKCFLSNQPVSINDPQLSTYFKDVEKHTVLDDHDNVCETELKGEEIYSSAIWDTRIGKKIASISNSKYSESAYTSFEGAFKAFNATDYDKGNWDFQPTHVVYVAPGVPNQPMTGRYYYQLTPQSSIFANATLTGGKGYIISFWATAPPTLTIAASNIALEEHSQVGGWKLYSATINVGFTITGLKISVPSGALFIDELRLHPAQASMTTTCYDPLFGPNSVCDSRNNINYFEYDVMGRQTVVRDIKRNVISTTKHIVQGNDNQ